MANTRDGAGEPRPEGEHDEETVHSAEEEEPSEAQPLGSDVNTWLPGMLSMMAETQRDLARKTSGGGHNSESEKKNNFGNVKIEGFYGDKGTSAYSYRHWKKSVEVTKKLHSLSDQDLAMIMYTQLKGMAKKRVEILELQDLERYDMLQAIWEIFGPQRRATTSREGG